MWGQDSVMSAVRCGVECGSWQHTRAQRCRVGVTRGSAQYERVVRCEIGCAHSYVCSHDDVAYVTCALIDCRIITRSPYSLVVSGVVRAVTLCYYAADSVCVITHTYVPHSRVGAPHTRVGAPHTRVGAPYSRVGIPYSRVCNPTLPCGVTEGVCLRQKAVL